MKNTIFITLILLLFSACSAEVQLTLQNDTKEVVQVSIISDEFRLRTDTVLNNDTQRYFTRDEVYTPHQLNMQSCQVDSLHLRSPLLTNTASKLGQAAFCYDSFSNLGGQQELNFAILPGKEIEIYYERYIDLGESPLSSVDTIYLKNSQIKVQLNGAEAIKAKVENAKSCASCKIALSQFTR
ncbi:MAG: hypothetical protein AAGG75_19540 [Bacteroidota bacterium]